VLKPTFILVSILKKIDVILSFLVLIFFMDSLIHISGFGKPLLQGSTGVMFGDVAGIDEAVEELQEVIFFFTCLIVFMGVKISLLFSGSQTEAICCETTIKEELKTKISI